MRNIWFLALTSFFADVAGEMIIPILPFFFTDGLGLSVALLGVVEGISDAIGTMLRTVFGYASDKAGRRKPFVIAGYLVAAFGKFFLVLAQSWPMVFVARLFDRSGKGIRTAPRDAIIASSVTKIQRPGMYGFHRMMDTGGAILGNVLVMILLAYTFSYQSIFWISLIPALLAVFLLLPVRDQSNHYSHEKFPSFREMISHRKFFGNAFWRFVFVSAIFQLGNIGYSFLLLRAKELGAGIVLIPILYLVFNIFQAVLSWPVGRIANRYGKEVLMLVGFAIFSVMSWGFVFGHSIAVAFVLFALYGVFYAFNEVLSRAIVADLLPDDRRASGLGAYSTLMGLMLIPASIIAGLLWKFGSGFGTFLYSALLSSLAAVIFFVFFANQYLWQKRNQEPDREKSA